MEEERLKKIEHYIGQIEKHVAASRSSLSPEIIKQIVNDVKEIKQATKNIPIMEERQRVLHEKVENMSTHSKEIALLKNNQSYIIRALWGVGAAGAALLYDLAHRLI